MGVQELARRRHAHLIVETAHVLAIAELPFDLRRAEKGRRRLAGIEALQVLAQRLGGLAAGADGGPVSRQASQYGGPSERRDLGTKTFAVDVVPFLRLWKTAHLDRDLSLSVPRCAGRCRFGQTQR